MLGACLGCVWGVLGCFGEVVGKCSGSVWELFGKCLGSVWECFGVFRSVWKCLGTLDLISCAAVLHFHEGSVCVCVCVCVCAL